MDNDASVRGPEGIRCARDLDSYAVVGISMGGYIALPFTFWFPDKVRQLVWLTRATRRQRYGKQGRTK
jgi:esterase/lipase